MVLPQHGNTPRTGAEPGSAGVAEVAEVAEVAGVAESG